MNYSSPITITTGGTYSGKNIISTDPTIPAIRVRTSQPVTINGANILSAGTSIDCNYSQADVTVTNSKAYGLPVNTKGISQGAFIDGDGVKRLVVENNSVFGTIGIYIAHSTLSTRVRFNRFQNQDGRYSNGAYGYSDGQISRFVQFNQVTAAYADISWNYVKNIPFMSFTEDVISMYKTSGTSTAPILIHDNLIWGSYPSNPLTDDFSGGGIMLGDSGGGYIKVYNNVVIDTVNYGIAASGGHDIEIYGNTIVSANLLPTGQSIKARNVGLYLWNMNKLTDWANVSAHDNKVGWNGQTGRNDIWNASGTTSNNTAITGPITTATEMSFSAAWNNSVNAQKLVIG